MDLVIFAAGLFVFVAHLLELLFQKTRIPDILLLMLLGVILGPGLFDVVQPEKFGKVGEFLSATTLVVLLCASGLSLKIDVLLHAAKRATPFALLSMCGAIALMSLLLIGLLAATLYSRSSRRWHPPYGPRAKLACLLGILTQFTILCCG